MIRDTSNLIQEIAAASQEQMAAIREINVGVSQLEEVVQQNAAASHELSATSTDLASQSSTLQHQVDFFQLDTIGKRLSRRARPGLRCARTPERRCERSRPGQAAPRTGAPAGSHRADSTACRASATVAAERSIRPRRRPCRRIPGRRVRPPAPPSDQLGTPPRGGVVVNLDDDDNFERFS